MKTIATAVQNGVGQPVMLYGTDGLWFRTISTFHNGILTGYTSNTVTIQAESDVRTYDANGKLVVSNIVPNYSGSSSGKDSIFGASRSNSSSSGSSESDTQAIGALLGVALAAVVILSFVLAPGLLANRLIDRKCPDVVVDSSASDPAVASLVKEVVNSAADPVTWAVSLFVWAAVGFSIWKLRSKPSQASLETEQLQATLSRCALLNHHVKFKEHGITDPLLPLLTDEQLQSIGIEKVGDRVRLLEEFRAK